jgi:DNA-binding winged helix-turn-helix (wHTH) protein/tetratricopeptide (TPR) repeat protein
MAEGQPRLRRPTGGAGCGGSVSACARLRPRLGGVAMVPSGEPADTMTFSFEEFELDAGLYELRRAGEPQSLEPKAFDLLRLLVEKRERVVTKDEILDTVWAGEHVTESVLPRAVNAIRNALGEDSRAPRFVATVRGRGYRFIADVTEHSAGTPVAGAPPGQTEAASETTDDGRFIGREGVRKQLRKQLHAVSEGRGRCLVISGDPGIGKTASFDWLLEEARRSGARVLVGRCSDSEGAPAFWPWSQVLRDALSLMEGLPETLRAEATELATLIPGLAGPEVRAEASKGADRFRLFGSAVEILRSLADSGPLIVGIEDLHWADVPSLMLMQFVASSIADAPILLVTTSRQLELDLAHPLRRTLGDLASQAHGHRIRLEGLPQPEVRDFLSSVLGQRARSGLADAVFEKTEGNPLFIREVAHMLAAGGEQDLEHQVARVTENVPESIRETLVQRLASLPESCRDLLVLAAFVGRDFTVDLLTQITGQGSDAIWNALEPAFSARILVDPDQTQSNCSFSHALFSECLHHEVPRAERPGLHRRIAEALEKIHVENPEPVVSELAWHFQRAIPEVSRERAIDYGLRAARRSDARLAYEKAAVLCERTLELLDPAEPSDAEKRFELLLRLGQERLRAGSQNRSRRAFEQAAEIARELERPIDFAHAVIGCVGWIEAAGQPDAPLRRLLEEALERIGPEEVALRVRLLGHLAGTDRYYRSYEDRGRLTEEAVALARELGEPTPLCRALSDRLIALQGPGEVEPRWRLSDECLALAEQTQNHPIRFRLHWLRFGMRLAQGDSAGARAELGEFRKLRELLRLVVPEAGEERMLGSLAMLEGRRDDAVAHIATAFELERRTGSRTATASFLGMSAWLLKDWEQLEQLEGWFDESQEAYFDWANRPMEVMRQCVLSEVGRTRELRERFDALAEEGFAEAPRDQLWMVFMAEMARLCVGLGDRDRAADLHRLLAPHAGEHVVEMQLGVYGGPVDAYLGLLAGLLGDDASAAAHLERARQACQRAGAKVYQTRAEADLAAVLAARGEAGDADRARDLTERARRRAGRLGLSRLEARLEAVASREAGGDDLVTL